MRTETITIYKYEELSVEAKERALREYCDINVHHDWFEYVYEEAATIGCKISAFNIDRGSYIDMQIDDEIETSQLILKNHGETCGTYKLAKRLLDDVTGLGLNVNDIELEDEDTEEEFDLLLLEFHENLKEEYLSILRIDYEYLISDEAIADSIIANEYEVAENGKKY